MSRDEQLDIPVEYDYKSLSTDGIQRLTAIARFVAPGVIDAEPLRLTG